MRQINSGFWGSEHAQLGLVTAPRSAVSSRFFQELPNAYDRAANGPTADFMDIVPRGYAQRIETSVKGFERCRWGFLLPYDSFPSDLTKQ